MNEMPCPREDELLEALGRGLVGAELSTHVASCTSCLELQLLAGALLDDRNTAIAEAPVPAAGTMWWRMRLRQRHEAQTAARRTLMIGQAATLLIAFAVVSALFGDSVVIALRAVLENARLISPAVALALGASLLLVPIAGWVAVRQK